MRDEMRVEELEDAQLVLESLRQAKGKYDEVLNALDKKQLGEGIFLRTNYGINKLAHIRYLARKHGYNVVFKKAKGGYAVIKVKKLEYYPQSRTVSEENRERAKTVQQLVDSGMTYEQVGQQLGVTRQRIEQIYHNFTLLPVEERVNASNSFMQPYLDAVGEKPVCMVCKVNPSRGGMCSDCRTASRMRTTIGSRIRCYKKTKKRHFLSMAKYLISKFNMKPEDLIGA